MELPKQVTSLELSKRLKELGVKQESLYRWTWINGDAVIDPNSYGIKPTVDDAPVKLYAAFTASELGELLPEDIEVHETGFFLTIGRALDNRWYVTYRNDRNHSRIFPYQEAASEAEARGRMLEYLIKNNLMSV